MSQAQILDPDAIESKPITFAPREWFFFKSELKDQIAEGNGLDILKALRAARFYAMIERSTKQAEEGKVITFTDEQWEAFVNAQNIH